ncbi:hypothetical protein ACEQUB_00609 [Ralstonia syzygii]
MVGPGIRYAFAYGLADPSFGLGRGQIRLSDAGKLMALAAFEAQVTPSRDEEILLDRMFSDPQGVPFLHKSDFHHLDVINRTSDLVRYAQEAGLDGFVVEGVLFNRQRGGSNDMVRA